MKPRPALCPLCDQEIFDYQREATYTFGGCKSMAHDDCVNPPAEENEGDDGDLEDEEGEEE